MSDSTPVQLYCPNCGHKVIGYKGEDGVLRIVCPLCKVYIVSKRRTKRKICMELTAPPNVEN